MAKRCSKCQVVKGEVDFYYRSDHPNLLQSSCIDCVKAKSRLNAKLSPTKKQRDRSYHVLNREKRIAYAREYNRSRKKQRAASDRIRYWNDVNFRIGLNLRSRIRSALKRNSKSSSTKDLIGCSVAELKLKLAEKFKPGMSWENYGLWQIDHIIPCAAFDLSKSSNQHVCFHFSNLQPLWAEENRTKSNKIMNVEVCHR